MYCYKCGREIDDTSVKCPYCGEAQVVHQTQTNSESDKFNIMSLIGFGLAIASVVIHVSFLTSIAALIVSIVGLMDCNKKKERGKIFAILGIVFSVLSLLFFLFIFSQIFGVYHDFLNPIMDEVIQGEIY